MVGPKLGGRTQGQENQESPINYIFNLIRSTLWRFSRFELPRDLGGARKRCGANVRHALWCTRLLWCAQASAGTLASWCTRLL
eukprot:6422637-Pyramimonas_sp.AAC.1